MRKYKQAKRIKIIIFFLVLAAGMFFLASSYLKAAITHLYDFRVCTNGANINDPNWPIIRWNVSNDTCKYVLQISDKADFSNILLDTGEQLTANYVYSQSGTFWPSHTGTRCPADINPDVQDVPTGAFVSAQYLGGACHDWFSGEEQCIPSMADVQRCINSEAGCYLDWESGSCMCSNCSKPGFSAEYKQTSYSSWGQTSFTYQTYLPRGKTYHYRVKVSSCGGGDYYIIGNQLPLVWTGWAIDSFATSAANSNPVVSNPAIAPVSDTCAAGTDFASAVFSWNYSDPDGDPQIAYRARGSWYTGKVSSGSHSYALNNLSCGTTYSFMVRAWDANNLASNWSNSASYTTPPLNHAPTAQNLQVAQLGDYCAIGPHASFSWGYTDVDGDAQNSWQIQVDNNSNFSSPEANSGRVYSTSNAYSTTNLNYNTTYYWRVRVWDSRGVVSSWISGSSFAPPKHRYPSVDFNWSPSSPIADEDVSFTDSSTTYGAAKTAWLWNFQNGVPAASVQQNPTIKFTSEGNKQVSLRVTDSDGYACTGYKTVNVNLPLPKWKEITPR